MRWDVCIYALECCYLLVCHPSFPSADHLCGQVCYFSATVHRRMQTRIERLCMRQHAKDQCRHVNRSSGVLYLCCSCDKMDRLLFFLLSLCFLARVVTGQVLLSLFLFLSFCRYLKELRSVSSSLFHIFSLHIFFNSISLHLYINIIFDGGIRRATPHSEPYLCMLAVSQRYASLILVIELRGDKLTHIHFCVKVFATRSNL